MIELTGESQDQASDHVILNLANAG